MKKELEICVRSLIGFEELKTKMIDIGFKVQEDFQLNDIYMMKEDREVSIGDIDYILSNYVLVRETVGKRTMLVIKDKKINEKGEVIFQKSTKCQIKNKEDGYNVILLRLKVTKNIDFL